MDILEKKPAQLPRIDGDCLVVPYNFEFPRISVITGADQDLEEVTERVSSGGCLMLILLGPLGLIFGWKSARITYYLESDLVKHTRIWRIACPCIAVSGLGLTAWSATMQSLYPLLTGLAAVTAALVFRTWLGRRVKISNVWDGEVFIRDLPEAVVNEVVDPKA